MVTLSQVDQVGAKDLANLSAQELKAAVQNAVETRDQANDTNSKMHPNRGKTHAGHQSDDHKH